MKTSHRNLRKRSKVRDFYGQPCCHLDHDFTSSQPAKAVHVAGPGSRHWGLACGGSHLQHAVVIHGLAESAQVCRPRVPHVMSTLET